MGRNNPLVSIIIPLHWGLKKENYERFLKDFKTFLNLDYDNYEILLVTDRKIELPFVSDKVRTIVVGKQTLSPSEKRDFALNDAKGEICAFIDDDAYPDRYWIRNAVRNFKDDKIVAVGGPGITPTGDSYWEKIGGYILESYLGSGAVQFRFHNKPKKTMYVDDYPAYNLFIRTQVLKKVGGYASKLYGGEDTYLCLRLIKEGKILYDSEVLVYHHRRRFPVEHLKQIASVGVHRGYFFKKYPKTSRHIFYLLPTLFTLGVAVGICAAFVAPKIYLHVFLLLLAIAVIAGTVSVKNHTTSWISAFVSGIGIIATHIVYGALFIRGLLTKKLVN